MAFYSYDANGNLLQGGGNTLTYNAYNKPILIQSATATQSFAYGPDLRRYKQVHSSLAGVRTTHYIDKLMEVIRQGDAATYKLYIGETAILTYSTLLGVEDAPPTLHYTLRDRLGSVVSVVDDSNTVIEHRSYDPFGKPRQGSLVSSSPATLSDLIGGTPVTERGFTDHEHLDDAQLIHMNGRVYDYNLGRFLSVDPFIQAPGNSQSLNPYSYIMNNPLAGTDPSGYLIVQESVDCIENVGVCSALLAGQLVTGSEAANVAVDNGQTDTTSTPPKVQQNTEETLAQSEASESNNQRPEFYTDDEDLEEIVEQLNTLSEEGQFDSVGHDFTAPVKIVHDPKLDSTPDPVTGDDGYMEVNGNEPNTIRVGDRALSDLKSGRYKGLQIGHELIHIRDFAIGGISRAQSEVNAYNWQADNIHRIYGKPIGHAQTDLTQQFYRTMAESWEKKLNEE
ncbi:RHS repeat domain-containing protein [Pseudidiomarina taiwanensis]|uniref:Teneurin-like YD-shell domain-containing protein n=1 Tax=Pseudidiomarina taiwanensis TaxID=337250 RepID=A0A432ZL47_9GAMM|nr:RHS repeat-associated core domain-containing protein [Pseudidiomarina taiwanensis]RUO78698.1 hypothetical protein CWI83_06675 [Pseudidiomarina taiwanensis]